LSGVISITSGCTAPEARRLIPEEMLSNAVYWTLTLYFSPKSRRSFL